MTLSHQFNLAPENMQPISRFKRAYRLIETEPKLRTAETDSTLRLLFLEAFPDHQDFPREIFRIISERLAIHGITPLRLPQFEMSAIHPQTANTTDLNRLMPFYTYVKSFYQCLADSESLSIKLCRTLAPR